MKILFFLYICFFTIHLYGQSFDSIAWVYFDNNSSQLRENLHLELLDTNKWEKCVTLTASTDTIGGVFFNQQLSNSRLESVTKVINTQAYFKVCSKISLGENYLINANYSNPLKRSVSITFHKKTIPPTIRTSIFNENDTLFEVGELFILAHIEFVLNEPTIQGKSYKELEKLYTFMLKNPTVCIHIKGHVCCGPGELLSTNRAKKIYDYLVRKGISEKRLSYKGYSNTVLSELSKNPNGPEQRRVEIEITSK